MDEKDLLESFRDPESTNEELALQLLSQYPHPEQVRDCWVGCNTDYYQYSLLQGASTSVAVEEK